MFHKQKGANKKCKIYKSKKRESYRIEKERKTGIENKNEKRLKIRNL